MEQTSSTAPAAAPGSRAAASEESTPLSQRSLWYRMRRNWLFYMLLLPTFLLLILFVYYPVILALVGSLFDWVPGVRAEFVGLLNFRRMFDDPLFWMGVRNIGIVVVWTFSIPFFIPFIVAELIYNLRSERARAFYRVAILVPILVPGLVTLQLWRWMYSFPDGGFNIILRTIGLGHLARPWLGTIDTALPAVLFMGFPWIVGITPLIYLAGLMNIPTEILDASKIDGCTTFRRVLSIDIPFLIGQFRLFLVIGTIGVLQTFGSFLILTGGGPFGATMVPGLYLYIQAFGLTRFEQNSSNMGRAAAVGVILFAVIFILTFISRRLRVAGIDNE